jgi:glycerophosphoryl diester phosphodiesterase
MGKKIGWFLWAGMYLSATTAHAGLAPWDAMKQRLSPRAAGGHQGGLFGYWPNTLAAFEDARAHGADVVEMDLHLTKDGIPVVFHDADLSTWTHCKGSVHDKTLAEIKQCRFLNSDQKIPSFEEVLQWAQGRIVVDAEFKDFESITPAIALVKKYNALPWTYFQTQNNQQKYADARTQSKDVVLLYSIHTDNDLQWAVGLNDPALLIIEVDKDMRHPDVLQAIHAAGKLVTEDVWHFDAFLELFTSTCYLAFEAGIDVGISNRPNGCVKQK